MGWSHPDGKDIFSVSEFIDKFKLEDLKAVGPSFDLTKLEWLNGEYIRQCQNSKLNSQIMDFYKQKLPEVRIEKTIPLVRERIKKLSDYLPLTEFLFNRPVKFELDLKPYRELLTAISAKLVELDQWKAEVIGAAMLELAEEKKVKNSEFFMVLRVAVSGKKITPPLNESLEILGKKEVLYRCENF